MTTWDWAALGLFLACWLGYGPLLGLLARRGGVLNNDMLHVRQAWMNQMATRELRLVDSQLMGHSINSASFFASANLLLIAAVAGVLFGGEAALRSVAAIGADLSGAPLSLEALEAKLGLITICLARGLMDFIWSIRQMNYTLALIGATPEQQDSGFDRAAYARTAGAVLNPAMVSFNNGVRAYYFALAATAWLFGPIWLSVGVASVFGLLLWRQRGSNAARAVRKARAMLEQG